jgi:tetratricopeptide (TPR) repeat protein
MRLNPQGNRIVYPNLLTALVFQAKFAQAESLAKAGMERFPDLPGMRRYLVNQLYMKGDLAAYRRAVDSVVTRGDSVDRQWARRRQVEVALLDGRVKEFMRYWNELSPVRENDPESRLDAVLDVRGAIRMEVLDEHEAFAKDLDAATALLPKIRMPVEDWPYLQFAERFALAGRPERAREWYNRYLATVKDTVRLREDIQRRQQVHASVLLSEKKYEEAIEEYRRSERLPDGPNGTCLTCLPIFVAFAFLDAGITDSAIVYMERALTVFHPNRMSDLADPFLLPLFNRWIAELYEKKGDREKAALHYRRFIELWKDADPELQPKVEDARARLRRLTDLELKKN